MKAAKKLCKILRHSAEIDGIPIDQDGYIRLSDLKVCKSFRNYKLADYKNIVINDEKQRFTLVHSKDFSTVSDSLNEWKIRANQGHSMSNIVFPMKQVTLNMYPYCIHGTFHCKIDDIMETGLKTMNRNHIHFIPPDSYYLLRETCSVLIHVDINRAIQGGIVFYLSQNGVILSAGDREGIIASKFFAKFVERKDESVLWTPPAFQNS